VDDVAALVAEGANIDYKINVRSFSCSSIDVLSFWCNQIAFFLEITGIRPAPAHVFSSLLYLDVFYRPSPNLSFGLFLPFIFIPSFIHFRLSNLVLALCGTRR
jgi:hypothetical protein